MAAKRSAPWWTILFPLALVGLIFVVNRRPPDTRPTLDSEIASSGAARRPGIALALVVDTSGSMSAPVAGRSKIETARTAVKNVIRKVEDFAKKRPELPVQVGVFEFSLRGVGTPPCRPVVALGKPDLAAAAPAVDRMTPNGNTPIGDAIVTARQELDRAGLESCHLLVVTDGENTHGRDPAEVVAAIGRRPEAERPSVYFVAFDVAASVFEPVKRAGALLLSASDGPKLEEALDFILGEKVLVEKPR